MKHYQKNLLIPLLMAIVMMAMSPQKMWADYSGQGTGTETDPFQISTVDELSSAISNRTTSCNYAKLTANIARSGSSLDFYNEWVLDLNGYTLSNTGAVGIYSGGDRKLTIRDSSTGKTGKVSAANYAITIYGGTVIIEGGTFEANVSPLSSSATDAGTSSLTLHGGTFKPTSSTSAISINSWTNVDYTGYHFEDANGNSITAGTSGVSGTIVRVVKDYDANGISTDGYQKPSGDGTSASPYQIANAGNLLWFMTEASKANTSNQTAYNAELTANIVVNQNVLNADGTLNTTNGTPAIAWVMPERFYGTFNGNNHTISGIYKPESSDNAAMFGRNDGIIRNLGVLDSYFGGNCYHAATFAANNYGTITDCYSFATIVGTSYNGGIAGGSGSNVISNCFFAGKMTSTSYTSAPICSDNSGQDETNTAVHNNYFLESCLNSGMKNLRSTSVTSAEMQSGKVAYLLQAGRSTTVWGQNLTNAPTDTYPVLGAAAVYLDKLSCDGVTIASDATYSNTACTPTVAAHDHNAHGICNVCGAYQQPAAGDGSSASPYEITNSGNLAWFRDYVNASADHNTACAKLMDNIDLSSVCHAASGETAEVSWTPIAADGSIYGYSKAHWCGVFDGNNKEISNLYINGGEKKSLFGHVGASSNNGTTAEIKYLKMTNVSVTVSGNYASAVCYYLYKYGAISNVEVVSGSVYASNCWTGGIAAYNYGTITHCTNRTSVTCDNQEAGGICYENNGTLENCANYGDVTSVGYPLVGGIASQGYGVYKNCVNYGKVSHTGNNSSTGYYASGITSRALGATIENCANFGDIYVKQDADKSGYIAGGGYLKALKGNLVNTGKIYVNGSTDPVSGTMVGSAMTWNNSQANDDTSTKYDITAAEAATGKYAYILQSYCTEATWGQDLSASNSLPTLGAAAVYATKLLCNGTPQNDTGYTNNSADVVISHSFDADHTHAAVPETCTTAGNTYYKECTLCGRYFDGSDAEIATNSWIVAAKGHDFSVLSSTAGADGLHTYECSHNCGSSDPDHKVIVNYAPNATGDAKNLVLSVGTGGSLSTTETIALTDDNQFAGITAAFTSTSETSPNYTRTIGTEWATLVLPFAISATQDGFDFYKIITIDSNNILYVEKNTGNVSGVIAAGTPVLVRRTDATKTSLELTATNGQLNTVLTDGTLKGTYASVVLTSANTGCYFIYNNALFNVSQLSNGQEVTVVPFHAYLQTASSNGSKLQIVVEDETTNLSPALSQGEGVRKYLENSQVVIVRNGKKYNLSGQEVK